MIGQYSAREHPEQVEELRYGHEYIAGADEIVLSDNRVVSGFMLKLRAGYYRGVAM